MGRHWIAVELTAEILSASITNDLAHQVKPGLVEVVVVACELWRKVEIQNGPNTFAMQIIGR